jgi:hypothetical protein
MGIESFSLGDTNSSINFGTIKVPGLETPRVQSPKVPVLVVIEDTFQANPNSQSFNPQSSTIDWINTDWEVYTISTEAFHFDTSYLNKVIKGDAALESAFKPEKKI